LFTKDAPNLRVTVFVSALHVDDADIRVEGRHGNHILAGVRVFHAANIRIAAFQVWSGGLIHGHERQASGSSLQARDHAEMGILFPLQTPGFKLFAHNAQ